MGELKNGGLQYQSLVKGSFKGAFEVLKFKVDVIMIYESVRGEKNETIFFIDATRMWLIGNEHEESYHYYIKKSTVNQAEGDIYPSLCSLSARPSSFVSRAISYFSSLIASFNSIASFLSYQICNLVLNWSFFSWASWNSRCYFIFIILSLPLSYCSSQFNDG